MKYFVLLFILIISGCCPAPKPIPYFKTYTPSIDGSEPTMNKVPTFIQWQDFNATKSLEEQKTSFIYFYKDNKESYRMNVSLSNPEVIKILNDNFDCYKFNMEEDIDAIGSHLLGVDTAPTIVFMSNVENEDEDEDAARIIEYNGYLRSSELVKLLEAFKSQSVSSKP